MTVYSNLDKTWGWKPKDISVSPGIIKIVNTAMTGVAQWVGDHSTKQKVTGLIPSQGTCLGCEPGPQSGCI